MNPARPKPPFAWQPITPRGVSAFAYASWSRLFGIQFIFALLAAVTLIWFLHQAWFPTIHEAIKVLPDGARIQQGTLLWPLDSPYRLAEGRFLSVAVDLRQEGRARSPAHIHVELGQNHWRIFSLFGFTQYPYSANAKGEILPLSRSEVEPWWGARSPFILTLAGLAFIVVLFVSWAVLATLYFLPVWLLGFFANRDLSLAGSWRLSAAALMPGALLLTAAILFYGLDILDPIRLILASMLHIVLGWFYILISPFKLLPHPAILPIKGNPFATSEQPMVESQSNLPTHEAAQSEKQST